MNVLSSLCKGDIRLVIGLWRLEFSFEDQGLRHFESTTNRVMVRQLFVVCLTFFPNLLFAQTASEHLMRGNEFMHRFDNARALEEYEQAYAVDTSNCTVLWKIAEASVNLGEEAGKKEQRQYYQFAESWARKAVATCPDTANGHFFVAVTSGKLALFDGGKAKINRSKEVKAEAEKTLQIDPNHHGAYHVLGRWHYELAKLSWILKAFAKIVYGGVPPGANYEQAVAFFKKAIAIRPDWIHHHMQLGIVYMKIKKPELARQEFQLALDLPVLDHEDEAHKKECRRLLEKIH